VQYCLRNQANPHISYSIRDSIRTEISDSQVPTLTLAIAALSYSGP